MTTTQLDKYRETINTLDGELMKLLARRLEVCRAVAHFKKSEGIPMMQPARVEQVKERAATMAQQLGLSSEFARDLYDRIIREACRLEDEIIDR